MKLKIPYGKIKIGLDIPERNVLDIIAEKDNDSGINEELIISEALNRPIKSKRLSQLARKNSSACIIMSDITRPCPSYKFLPQLISELHEGRIENKNIRIILGLGIHRNHTEEEKRKLVGDFTFNNIEVMDSDISKTELIGYTPFNTPVEVFKGALGFDLLIVTGNIEYHYFAGYSGGAKAVMPGLCSRNSIQSNHSMMLDNKATLGNFYDNPIRQDIEEAGKLAGIDFLFNIIVNDNKNIIAAVAGKNNDAYIEGINRYDSIYKREVEQIADIVITSQGGYPKDLNLYQSQKALENIKEIIGENTTVILVASCCEGFGENVFEEWMAYVGDYHLISNKIREKFVLGGHKAVAISKLLKKVKILLYSEFDKDSTEKMGFNKLDNIQKYLNYRISMNGNIKITAVPTGRFVRLKK